MTKQLKAFAGSIALAVLLSGAARAQGTTDAPPAELKLVDPQTVCMVNDHAMGKPQIPVVVDEKMYYGCCDMCKQRLAQDEAVRYAIDPVTGERVDKAKAVIAERADGSVLYFASAETLGRYGKTEEQKKQ